MGKSDETVWKIRVMDLYHTPQYIWLVILYYLMLNSFFDHILPLIIELSSFNINVDEIIPKKIEEYNKLFLSFLDEYMPYTMLLSIGLFFSGIVIFAIRFLPILREYRIIRVHSTYGFSVCIWFFLISFTHYLYTNTGGWFPLTILLLYVILEGWKYLVKRILEKINPNRITF